jgi:putative NIF3 family GTP cyclohydrolase 1 type 2
MARAIIARVLLMTLLAVFGLISMASQERHPTAQQIVERIQKSVGVPWHEPTVDTFKAGDPSTPVTGVAVTMMATLDVLQHAANGGDNLIITHEPTFYGHLDETVGLAKEADPVFVAKEAFIREHHLVIWRFHDFWHERKPDGILTGMIGALNWGKFQNASNRNVFDLPSTTLGQLATDIQAKLSIRTLRVVGDASVMVTRIALSEGFAGFETNRRLFQFDGVDVLVIGEDHEWETIEYAADATTAGKRKGLIVLGHVPSEQAGMEECARWLRSFVHEVPVHFVATAEPFWRPEINRFK